MKTQIVPTIVITIVIAIVFIMLPVMTSQAGSLERQHAAHVHGLATGTLARDEDRLSLTLVMPGMNLVGFEHAPRDEVQRTRLDEVKYALESGDWIDMDPDGGCRIDSMVVTTPGFDERSGNDHDHGHSHDHADQHGDADHPHHEHAEFHLDVGIVCAQADQLDWIELDLFADFPDNDELRIDVLTDTRADRLRLRAGDTRVELR